MLVLILKAPITTIADCDIIFCTDTQCCITFLLGIFVFRVKRCDEKFKIDAVAVKMPIFHMLIGSIFLLAALSPQAFLSE